MSLKHFLTTAACLSLLAGTAVAMEPPKTEPAKSTQPAKPADKTDKPADNKTDKPKKEKVEPTLKVGSKAPEIKVDKWVKGTEVKSFEAGKVYVVEFWATWCGPCRKAIPHLTEMQKADKDVTFIGVAGSERMGKDTQKDERLANVEKFVKEQGDKMDYHVAYDATRAMPNAWLRPAGQDGIPCAFVVDGEGKIAWIGNPLTNEGKDLAKSIEDAKKKAKIKA